MKSMHFLFTAPRYHTNQHFPVRALLDAGHQVSFLTLTSGQSEVYEALHPTVIGYSRVFSTVRKVLEKLFGIRISDRNGIPSITTFWNEMIQRKPTVVIVRNPNSPYGLLSVAVTKLIGSKLVFYTQTPKYRDMTRWKKFLRWFAIWITQAQWITPLLGSPSQGRSTLNNLHYVPFVMRPQTDPTKKTWFSGEVINILAIGKYEGRKNHRLFLDAIQRLSSRYAIRATVVGECTTSEHSHELAEIKQYSKSIGLYDKADFKVNLSSSEIHKEYATHDVFVLASRDDPAAISPLEAMAHSLPVVCSDSNGTKCYIKTGENGFVFRTNDLHDLEVCVDRILQDKQKLILMGNNSYRLVVSNHSPARYVKTLLSIVEENSD